MLAQQDGKQRCLNGIARELVNTVRRNVTIDWTLRKHGYPPDKQEKATQTVLEQAEVLSDGWAVA